MSALLLGSTSSYRRSLLERLQVPFACEAPGIDENAVKKLGWPAVPTVQELARRKAQAVFGRNPSHIVIGSDQAVVVNEQLLDKPGTRENAIAQLRQLRGREHRLLTAVAIAHKDGLVEFLDTTRLRMRDLTDDEIHRYVHADMPLDCAGSYKIESLGITLFAHIESQDHTAITGLPLLQLSENLRKFGVALP